jgi:hypothetical protein
MSAGVRWRRARAALLALAVAVVAPVAMGVGHAKQVPGGQAGVPAVARPVGPGVWVTLVTGDRVLVSAGRPASVRPGAGRERVRFHQFNEQGDRYVLPTDAAVLVARGGWTGACSTFPSWSSSAMTTARAATCRCW